MSDHGVPGRQPRSDLNTRRCLRGSPTSGWQHVAAWGQVRLVMVSCTSASLFALLLATAACGARSDEEIALTFVGGFIY